MPISFLNQNFAFRCIEVGFGIFFGVSAEYKIVNRHKQGVVVFEVSVVHVVIRRAVKEIVKWGIHVPRWKDFQIRMSQSVQEIKKRDIKQRRNNGGVPQEGRY